MNTQSAPRHKGVGLKLCVLSKKFSPLYSYLSKAKGMNVRWVLGCKAENPDLTITKIGSFYFPNFVE
jgi:hypothetical protein